MIDLALAFAPYLTLVIVVMLSIFHKEIGVLLYKIGESLINKIQK